MRRAALAAVALLAVDGAQAQERSPGRPIFVNDEWERYARVLQVSGDVPLYPWTIRSFGAREHRMLAPDSSHPWISVPGPRSWTWRNARVTTIPATAGMTWNSAFPFGYNDGAVWAGRGLTAAVAGGVSIETGPVSVVLAPQAFHAQNDGFLLRDNGQSGIYAYGAPYSAHEIDQPQRFGDGGYTRLDPGNSSARIDIAGAAFGFSNAPMHWGPARDHPLLFGNNAAGFFHFFAGSSTPVDVWVGRVHARMLWGKLGGTPYARVHETYQSRFGTGLVATLIPRGAPGLEIGGSRFFHVLWEDDVISESLWLSFKELPLPNTTPRTGLPDNQLASLFARWAFPGAGFEMYGEFAREDHSANLRDVELEPDHNSAYLVGFQRVLGDGDTRRVIRGELLNSRISGLVESREQTMWYTHLPVAQGHTQLGQVLGSIGTFGGGAATLGFDSYSPSGRWTVSWSRIMRGEDELFPSGITVPERADVQHALSVSGIRRRGALGITYEATWVRELNRDLRGDASNLRLATGVEYAW